MNRGNVTYNNNRSAKQSIRCIGSLTQAISYNKLARNSSDLFSLRGLLKSKERYRHLAPKPVHMHSGNTSHRFSIFVSNTGYLKCKRKSRCLLTFSSRINGASSAKRLYKIRGIRVAGLVLSVSITNLRCSEKYYQYWLLV